jgi:hypothetical protein
MPVRVAMQTVLQTAFERGLIILDYLYPHPRTRRPPPLVLDREARIDLQLTTYYSKSLSVYKTSNKVFTNLLLAHTNPLTTPLTSLSFFTTSQDACRRKFSMLLFWASRKVLSSLNNPRLMFVSVYSLRLPSRTS